MLLVEDRFAKLFVEEVFKYFSSSLFNEYFIDFLSGESHVVETSKHYKSSSFNMISILDADQKGKVEHDKLLLPICFLPSATNKPPEEEIIAFIKSNLKKYADIMKIERIEILGREIHSNHHDWCGDLAAELEDESLTLELEKKAIKLWIESNRDISELFVLYIENSGNFLTGKIVNIDNLYCILYKNIKILIDDISLHKYRIENFIDRDVKFKLHSKEDNIKVN